VARETERVDGGAVGAGRTLALAETALIAERDRLRMLQEDAFFDGRYDPDAYDAAILSYREAQAEARIVRAAWRCWQAELTGRTAPR
jgi:hypothetical protein